MKIVATNAGPWRVNAGANQFRPPLIEFSHGRSIKLRRSLSSRALIASMIVSTIELPIEIETIRMFL